MYSKLQMFILQHFCCHVSLSDFWCTESGDLSSLYNRYITTPPCIYHKDKENKSSEYKLETKEDFDNAHFYSTLISWMNQFLLHKKEQEKLYLSIIGGLLTTVILQAIDLNFRMLESDVRISNALLFVFLGRHPPHLLGKSQNEKPTTWKPEGGGQKKVVIDIAAARSHLSKLPRASLQKLKTAELETLFTLMPLLWTGLSCITFVTFNKPNRTNTYFCKHMSSNIYKQHIKDLAFGQEL